MDSAAGEARDNQPIKADLERLNKVNNTADVLREVISLRVNGAGSPLKKELKG